jgi:hypothetical protein
MFTKIGAWIASLFTVFNFGVTEPQETEPAWAQPDYVETEHIETENIETENIVIEDIQRERYEGEIYVIEDAPVTITVKETFGDNVETWDNSPNVTRWD